ncbi:MAG: biopolymer transporter ExbD [Planctomycetes bacterium]|nr:biopolymer transporter ExbD [Planctomycetota bacterium]
MQLTKHRRQATSRMNMTPMIDVVFLLLIFFMTVTQVSEVNRERIELPQQKGVEDQKPAELIINVMEDGRIVVSGNTVTMPRLVAILSETLREAGGNPMQVDVVLRADARGTSATVNDVVETLNKMEMRRVRIAVQVPR